jgi:hypothetical protein
LSDFEISVPNFPAQESGCFKYLASIGLTEEQLSNCCVKKARVIGIADRQHIDIVLDGVQYDAVPVWIHTDVGARLAMLKGAEHAQLKDYFKDASLMFPFPGVDEASSSYVSALTSIDAETMELVVHAVIGVQRCFSPPSGPIQIIYQTDVSNYIQEPTEKAFPTYRPFMLLETYYTSNAGDVTSAVMLVDLVSGGPAFVPSLDSEGEWCLPKVQALFSGDDVAEGFALIGAFLGRSVEVGSGDCFKSLSVNNWSTDNQFPKPDPEYPLNRFGSINGDISFQDRDTGATITITTRNIFSPSDNEEFVYQGTNHLGAFCPINDKYREMSWGYVDYYDWYGSEILADRDNKYSLTKEHSLFGSVSDQVLWTSEWVANMENGELLVNNKTWNSQYNVWVTECKRRGDWVVDSLIRYPFVTDREVDFCKNNLFDVYWSVRVTTSYFETSRKEYRGATTHSDDVLLDAYDPVSSFLFPYLAGEWTSWLTAERDVYVIEATSIDLRHSDRETGLFNSVGVIESALAAMYSAVCPVGEYDQSRRTDHVLKKPKLYLVPYDPRIDMLQE